MYKETSITLDALDLLNIRSLIEARIKDAKASKRKLPKNGIPAMLIDEAVDNHEHTLGKINAALGRINPKLKAS
jgi:hypothetical protein